MHCNEWLVVMRKKKEKEKQSISIEGYPSIYDQLGLICYTHTHSHMTYIFGSVTYICTMLDVYELALEHVSSRCSPWKTMYQIELSFCTHILQT